MKEPWNQCGLCSAKFGSWPHRTNHFRKNHAGMDPKVDHTGTKVVMAEVLGDLDAQDAEWESLPALDDFEPS
jgi:hypothetical protein